MSESILITGHCMINVVLLCVLFSNLFKSQYKLLGFGDSNYNMLLT